MNRNFTQIEKKTILRKFLPNQNSVLKSFHPDLDFTQGRATKSYGLILVVGPTGSGKTTALHPISGFINKPESKIWTFHSLAKEHGDGFEKLGIEHSDDFMLKKPVGCENCNDIGYAGRTGLHECLEGTDTIKRMIMKQALIEESREHILSDGTTTLKQDGIYKIFKGDCDLKQVMAVCIVWKFSG